MAQMTQTLPLGQRLLLVMLPLALMTAAVSLICLALRGPEPDSTHTHPQTQPETQTQADRISDEGFPRTLLLPTVDDTAPSKSLTLLRRPRRIVSCMQVADENLEHLVPLTRIAAVTRFGVHPVHSFASPQLRRAVETGAIRLISQVKENTEMILSLKPDLLFCASWTDPKFVRQMEQAGVPVIVTKAERSVADARATLALMIQAVGAERGDAVLRQFDERLATVRRRVAERKGAPKKVLYVTVEGGELAVIGRDTSLDDVLTCAGLENLAATELRVTGFRSVGLADVLELDRRGQLEWLMLPPTGTDDNGVRVDHLERLLNLPGANQLRVLEPGYKRVIRVPSRLVVTTSIHIVDAVEWFAQTFQAD